MADRYAQFKKHLIPVEGATTRSGKPVTNRYLMVAEVPGEFTDGYVRLASQFEVCNEEGEELYTCQFEMEVVITK
jgi:hypothetical protein